MIDASDNYINALSTFRQGQLPVLIEIEGYARQFIRGGVPASGDQYPWIVSIENIDTSVDDLNGGANQVTCTFNVQDVRGQITADFPNFVFEGKRITVKAGLPGLSQSDWVTVFTGYIDNVISDNANTEYQFACSDISSRLSKVVFTTGDSGLATDSDNIKTVIGHPMDILISILEDEVGFDASSVDEAKIFQARDGVLAGLTFKFNINQPPAAADFITNQILKPLGGYLWVNHAGLISVNFFYPVTGTGQTPVATLGPDAWTSIPTASQVDMVNTVQYQFDKDDSNSDATGNYLAQDTEEYGPSVDLYGQFGEIVIQADGMRSSFQGFFIAKFISRLIFFRYGLKNLKFDEAAADAIWRYMRLESGDIVQVTHPKIPDRQNGVIGVTARQFEVLNRSLNLTEGLITLTMIDASYLARFGEFKITPDTESDFASASSADKAHYMFLCDDSDQYSDASDGHTLALVAQ